MKEQFNLHNFFAFHENIKSGIESLHIMNLSNSTISSFFDIIQEMFSKLKKFRKHLNV